MFKYLLSAMLVAAVSVVCADDKKACPAEAAAAPVEVKTDDKADKAAAAPVAVKTDDKKEEPKKDAKAAEAAAPAKN